MISDDKAQADQCSLSWGDIWSQHLLGAFEREEDPVDDVAYASQSDGAVYSRYDEVFSEIGGQNVVDVETRKLPLRFFDANSVALISDDQVCLTGKAKIEKYRNSKAEKEQWAGIVGWLTPALDEAGQLA
ncbi:hypothetical protein CSAL01_08014 [Colletotrichum salicis]|uniref:Uncharacterized protein n=1 Tax=Colletotrichum salicis TaxID=1209931 RepID=A0A135S4Y8_9PEZI|nr:hypothetical protein CSAL01_08014 [Colletotrichum salicis]